MQTRVLLFGVGGYAYSHARRLLSAEHGRENVLLAGVVDPFAEKSEAYPELIRQSIPIYQTASEFFKEHSAELSIVATPIPYHAEQAIACMRAGSGVYLEKPIAATSEQARAILRARDETKMKLGVGFQWCWDPVTLRLKELVETELGKPLRMRVLVVWPRDFKYYHRGSGWAGKAYDAQGRPIFDSVAFNATAHYLMNIFFVAGRAPLACEARTFKANDIEMYDTAFLRYQLEGGGEALFVATHAAESGRIVNPMFEYEFEHGVARYDSVDMHVRVTMRGTEIDLGRTERGTDDVLWQMVDAVRGEGEIHCTGEDAMMHLSAIELARAAQPEAKRFCHVEKDDARAWAPGLYDAVLHSYQTFTLPGVDWNL